MPGTPRVVNRERFSNAGVGIGIGSQGGREFSQSPASDDLESSTGSPLGPPRRLRWNVSWKVLLMGFIVVYQIMSLLTVHPTDTDAEERSLFNRFFSARRQEDPEDLLSAPVAPDYPVPDVRPIDIHPTNRRDSAHRKRRHRNTTTTTPDSSTSASGSHTSKKHPHRASDGSEAGHPLPLPTREPKEGRKHHPDVRDVREGHSEDTGRNKGSSHTPASTGPQVDGTGGAHRRQEGGAEGDRNVSVIPAKGHGGTGKPSALSADRLIQKSRPEEDDAMPKMSKKYIERGIRCPALGALIGYLGATLALGLSCLGAAAGISKAGSALSALAIHNKSEALRGMLPIVMAELLSIYGLISAVSITIEIGNARPGYPLSAACVHLAAGLSVGGSSLIAGQAIGIIGSECNRLLIRTRSIFSASVLLLIFCEAIALYGLIASLLLGGLASTLATSHQCLL
eukprot:TRINITY_DN21111_c0_g1_i1.p1 TRINITY_DN21111_c0_g1~~TRINITY_DN21111_c0_g1_i1.p1  ORF type:complete len:532 (+),score=51.25 TRINITY_DN21111_c0_g1_i1:236-1597(+)